MSTLTKAMDQQKTTPVQPHHRPPATNTLEIKNLHAEIDGKEILKGIDLNIKSGEIHVVMGPNGSGKSTLCNLLMGNPKYEATQGEALLNGEDILELEPNERANRGLFLGFQHPIEIPGVTLGNFLRLAKNANNKANDENAEPLPPVAFLQEVKQSANLLNMGHEFIGRSVNQGFSGGEKKRAEIVQMATLQPKIALLDEIDSGLDIDALKAVAHGINETFASQNMGILLITHYQRILNYITPHFVHVIANGKIVKSGDSKLAQELEESGYEKYLNN